MNISHEFPLRVSRLTEPQYYSAKWIKFIQTKTHNHEILEY